jgi:hypothetical protein
MALTGRRGRCRTARQGWLSAHVMSTCLPSCRARDVTGTSYSIFMLKTAGENEEPCYELVFPAELSDDLAAMHNLPGGREYHLFTLSAVDGQLSCSSFSGFVGWAEGHDGWELRAPSLVDAEQILMTVHVIPCLVVEGARQFAIWNALGGRALVERRTAEKFMPDRLQPSICVPHPSGTGFVGIANVAERELQYAPSKKLRMQVLLRDNHRCRSCGRGPATNPDVELHVHHVRPWGIGGLTHPFNLLTLCHTCHRGLPGSSGWDHYVPSLHSLIPGWPGRVPLPKAASDHQESVLQYRMIIAKKLALATLPSAEAELRDDGIAADCAL